METNQKVLNPERPACSQGNFYKPITNAIGPGMNERIQKLRKISFETEPSLSIERALIQTQFYKENFGKYSIPVLRALNFLEICTQKTIYLGEGCFWCTEAFFQRVNGVISVESGYGGGFVENPTYEQVCDKNTGHVELAKVVFDPAVVSIDEILEIFWKTHDPTTLDQQGNDIGTQYRSAIFATNNEQILLAEDLIKKIDALGVLKSKITTEVNTFNSFFSAEENHQKYLKKFPDGYSCHFIRDINFSF